MMMPKMMCKPPKPAALLAANILAPVEMQCDWLREIGYEEVDSYFRIYELAVFAGRKPNQKS